VTIYHLTTPALWEEARVAGSYEADSLASEGFIHCSEEQQVAAVANARFRGRTDLVVLHVDEQELDAPVKRENLDGGTELFPHIYGPLRAGAVTHLTPLVPGEEGQFAFPAE
jgi:uncharacterized protein (DUF952 family)